MTSHVFHWRHGWIPLSGPDRMSKANGNPGMAASMLAAARGDSAGIRSRRDIAHAVRDLVNVPQAHRLPLKHEMITVAQRFDATDLLPPSWLGHVPAAAQHRRAS